MGFRLRDFSAHDTAEVNALAVSAFAQYREDYADWPAFRTRIADMAALADAGELIVAEDDAGSLVGAVAYIGPHQPKSDIFAPEWPIMRMLVVSPAARGLGVGRALALECLARAERDQAAVFALHTSEIMAVALPMYRRMGFNFLREAPAIHGVPYGIYIKVLGER
ncbi:MAG: GNAT family N-acetyltransferase [Betaproteobacteria bacterium]